jgi:MEMO1 family protein
MLKDVKLMMFLAIMVYFERVWLMAGSLNRKSCSFGGGMTFSISSRCRYLISLIVVMLLLQLGACQDKKDYEANAASELSLRTAVFGGSWYPADAYALSRQIDSQLAEAGRQTKVNLKGRRIMGLIVPHAGYKFSLLAQASAYRELMNRSYDRIVIMGPSHHVYFEGVSILGVDGYSTPLGTMKLDRAFIAQLRTRLPGIVKNISRVHSNEHSVEIQIPILQRTAANTMIVPIVFGDLGDKDSQKLADVLRKLGGPRTLFIASSDFTHYGDRFRYMPFPSNGPGMMRGELNQLDMGAVKTIQTLDAENFLSYKKRTGITICGYAPIATLMRILKPAQPVDTQVLSYYTSGDITGDWNSTVSYVSLAFVAGKGDSAAEADRPFLTPTERSTLLKLSREALEKFVRTGSRVRINTSKYAISEGIKRKVGAFVTLKKRGMLRGCIGYITGLRPINDALYDVVIDNTINAASKDNRFAPVQVDELDDIDIEISVLTPLRPITSVSEIIVGTHGLYIEWGPHRGVLLPQVPVEQGWNRAEYLEGICRKARLPANGWQTAKMKVFTADVFGEK